MGRLAHHGVTAHAELAREHVESRGVGFTQGRKPLAAVAINPAHVTRALPRHFDEIAEKILFRFGQIHRAHSIARRGDV